MSKASDFIDDYVMFIPDQYRAPWTKVGPGGMIEKMSQEKRDLLKTLKSDDWANIRPDALWITACAKPKRKGRWGL